jgi:NAD(P)-dependent dehydrogenase (short-subunit alcohol dehydrogenase family)
MLASFPAGSRALITGSSRGIGLEFVRQLLADPRFERVFAGCREPQQAGALASLAAVEPRVRPLRLDVADEPGIAAAAAEVAAGTDRLHLVVNCAGVLHGGAAALAPEKRLADVRSASLV